MNTKRLPLIPRQILFCLILTGAPLISSICWALSPETNPAPDNGNYRIETLASGLDHPWSMTFLPDNSYLISLRSGSLHRAKLNAQNVMQIGPAIENTPDSYIKSQGGYFDIVLDPDFAENQRIYLSYAAGSRKANATEVISAQLNGNKLESIKTIFRVTPDKSTAAHYGGRLAFLSDGTLLMTSGEGFEYREAAQDPFSQLGKVVRFNHDGSIPKDNPFADGKNANPFVYTLGHRNAQGLYVDHQTGTVYLHEHGARGGDEVNILMPGKNYGWPVATHGVNYSGAIISPHKSLPGMEDPIQVWIPSIAPSGLTLYRGNQFPQWDNSLLVSALAAREVRRLQLDAKAPFTTINEETLFSEIGERIRDVSIGPDGFIYLLTDSNEGKILRVVPAAK